ncbi:hypothetical protein [Candidatus Sororendozoicomonas aggregata]|uniref:hypothetical protein n=1 Tax=Candidatus Sororendozoicomonas aggregata TaxID=3073239 RepID=UPI002ED4C92E
MKLRRSDGGDDNQAGDSVMIKPFGIFTMSVVYYDYVARQQIKNIPSFCPRFAII